VTSTNGFKSKKSDNPYRDYYHWWPAEKGTPFRPGSFEADGSGWRYDKTTDSYYIILAISNQI
jgi:oligo-1,6-glucosidase